MDHNFYPVHASPTDNEIVASLFCLSGQYLLMTRFTDFQLTTSAARDDIYVVLVHFSGVGTYNSAPDSGSEK